MDLIKSIDVFDPSRLRGQVGVVGVGALGSAVALQLAKAGIESMTLWDADKVELHNLCNQVLYGPEDVGCTKSVAASSRIEQLTGLRVSPVDEMLTSRMQLNSHDVRYLFVCVDSMKAREDIFKSCVWLNPNIEYFNEARMSSRTGIITAFEPNDISKSKEYMARLYPDSDVVQDRAACGTIMSIGATAMMIACQMVWHFMNIHPAKGESINNWEELFIDCDNLHISHKGLLVESTNIFA